MVGVHIVEREILRHEEQAGADEILQQISLRILRGHGRRRCDSLLTLQQGPATHAPLTRKRFDTLAQLLPINEERAGIQKLPVAVWFNLVRITQITICTAPNDHTSRQKIIAEIVEVGITALILDFGRQGWRNTIAIRLRPERGGIIQLQFCGSDAAVGLQRRAARDGELQICIARIRIIFLDGKRRCGVESHTIRFDSRIFTGNVDPARPMRDDAGPVAADRGQRPIAGDVQRTVRIYFNCRPFLVICPARVQQIVSIQGQIYNAVLGNPYYRVLEALAGNMHPLKRHVIGTVRPKPNRMRFFFCLEKAVFPGVCDLSSISHRISIRIDVDLTR